LPPVDGLAADSKERSLSRAERLLELMQCLRRHRYPVSGGILASDLGISLRTLYRDIAALQAQGARIDAARLSIADTTPRQWPSARTSGLRGIAPRSSRFSEAGRRHSRRTAADLALAGLVPQSGCCRATACCSWAPAAGSRLLHTSFPRTPACQTALQYHRDFAGIIVGSIGHAR